MQGELFSIYEAYTDKSSNENFHLHNHDEYEIYLFFEGDCRYVVENKNYNLSPGDIIIIRRHEMHRVFHNLPAKYHRFVLMVSPKFFKEHGCGQYEKAFLGAPFSEGNKINSKIVHSIGLYGAISRLKKYCENYNDFTSPVCISAVIEILYLINNVSLFEPPITKSPLTENVITYINSNLNEALSLDDIAEKFFVSKYHLCHSFKKSTGITVLDYIKQKRLLLADEFIKMGKSLSQAATLSGFCDYSSFYRAYLKRYGQSPKTIIKRG